MTFYSDTCFDSNEFIVKANTEGAGQFRPLFKVDPEPSQEYIEAAAAYWTVMRKSDGDTGLACDALWQTLNYHHIECPDKEDLSRALYLESPYYEE